MSYWKTKVLPKIKKFLDKGSKKGVGIFTKKFDTQKEAFGKDIEDKKEEFQPKVVEIYKNSPPETQAVLKSPSEESLKENPDAVQALLVELGKAGIPGAQIVSDAAAKFGVANLPEPVLFVLGKVAPFVVDEPAPVLPPAPEAAPKSVDVTSKEIEVTATSPTDTSAEPSSATKEVEVPATTPAPAAPAVEEKKPETVATPPEPAPATETPAATTAPVTPPPAAPTTTPEVAAPVAIPAPAAPAPAPSS